MQLIRSRLLANILPNSMLSVTYVVLPGKSYLPLTLKSFPTPSTAFYLRALP